MTAWQQIHLLLLGIERQHLANASALYTTQGTRACHQLAGFGRWAPPEYRMGR
jgi:hypothetical protein